MKRVIGNLLWATGSKLLDAAVRFFTVPIVLAHFGKLDFGLLALAYAVNVFLTIADFGLNINAVRRLSDQFVHHDWPGMNRLVSACTFYYSAIGLINFVGVLVVGYMAPLWFNLDAEQSRVFWLMMISLGLSSWVFWTFIIHRQVIQAAGQLGWDERNTIVATIAAVVLVAVTVYAGLDLVTYFALSMALGLIPVALRWWKVHRLLPGFKFAFAPDWASFRPMVNASLLLFLMSLAQMAANNLRPLLLASQGTLESVADYRIIQGVVSFALMVSGGVLNVVYPEVARLEAQGDTGRLRDFSQRGTSLLLWAHVLLLVPLALSSELILRLYVGAEFTHLTLPLAVWLLTCMAGHNAIFSSVLLSRGRFGLLTASSIFNAALTLWLAYLLIPQHGLNAVVWTYVLFVVLQALVFYGFLIPPLRLGSLRQFALMLFKPVAGAAVATVLSLALAHTVGLPLWTAGLFAALAIVVLSLGFGEVLANLRVLMPARLP